MQSLSTLGRLKSSLSFKVVVLVVVPLLVQLAFLAWLIQLQVQSEHALERSVHAKEVADAIANLKEDIYTTVTRFRERGNENTPLPLGPEGLIAPAMRDYTRLQLLTKYDDPALHRAIEESRKEAVAGLRCLLAIRDSMKSDPSDSLGRAPLWFEARHHLSMLLRHDLEKVAKAQTDLAHQSMAQQAEYRLLQLRIMGVLGGATLIWAVASVMYLVRGITLRIAKVNDNAYRLASDRPLNPVLEGSDEIARLDQNFHRMAIALKDAEMQKQEIVLMVTHDLRTPLTTLRTIHQFLRSGDFGKLDAKGSEYIMVANRNVARMSNMVNDLLDIDKVKSGLMTIDIQAFELFDCFTAARELAGALADDVGVKVVTEPTELLVKADQDRITRVIANLIANAIRFSPQGGTVTVAAKQEGVWVHTTVEDEGPGIPVDQLQHIFERFYQLKSAGDKSKGGSGLGLTICHAIVELHGGKIWVENRQQGGSRFIFTLKAAE